MGLEQKPSLAWNPQSNAILERMHQVLQDCLASFELDDKDMNENDAIQVLKSVSVKTYTRIDMNDNKKRSGFIAQDFQNLPESLGDFFVETVIVNLSCQFGSYKNNWCIG